MTLGKILHSIHGKQVGQMSSGGITFTRTTSSAMGMAAEMSTAGVFDSSISSFNATIGEMEVETFKSVLETISTSEATLNAYGISVLSSGTATSRVFSIGAPAVGTRKTVHSVSSATTIVLDTTADTIGFNSCEGASSTRLTFSVTAGCTGRSIVLDGLSTTRWGVLSHSPDIT